MANSIIDALTEHGCDTQAAIARFIGKEDLYIKFLKKFLDDPSYKESVEAVRSHDIEKEISAVHTVKGVAGNLGFTRLYNVAAFMVDRFRAGDQEIAEAELDHLTEAYNEVCGIISE